MWCTTFIFSIFSLVFASFFGLLFSFILFFCSFYFNSIFFVGSLLIYFIFF